MPTYHFVVNPHDPNLEWREILPKFEATKALVVLENKKGKLLAPHTHVQMDSPLTPSEFAKLQTKYITEEHYKRKLDGGGNSRPVKRATRVDDVGYQYVLKQPDSNVLHTIGFADEDLDDLREASEEYVEELKHSGEEPVWEALEKHKAAGFEVMKKEAFRAYYDYVVAQSKPITPQYKWRVLTIMSRWQAATEGFKQCLSELLSK